MFTKIEWDNGNISNPFTAGHEAPMATRGLINRIYVRGTRQHELVDLLSNQQLSDTAMNNVFASDREHAREEISRRMEVRIRESRERQEASLARREEILSGSPSFQEGSTKIWYDDEGNIIRAKNMV